MNEDNMLKKILRWLPIPENLERSCSVCGRPVPYCICT